MLHISADSINITCCNNAPATDVELLSSGEYVSPDTGVVDDAVVRALVVFVSILVSSNGVMLMRSAICKSFYVERHFVRGTVALYSDRHVSVVGEVVASWVAVLQIRFQLQSVV